MQDTLLEQHIANLDLLINKAEYPANRFSLSENCLSMNWFFASKESSALRTYLQDLINDFATEKLSCTNPLYTSLQYFLHLKPNRIIDDLNLALTDSLKRQELRLIRLDHSHDDNQFNAAISNQALPEINYDPQSGHYTSPDDDKAHQHGAEAQRIFFATQWERFKSLCNSLFAFIGIHVFETARYREHDYLDSDIYAHHSVVDLRSSSKQEASHYWIGHASNFLTIPTKTSPLYLLTDPVEGDLAPLLYPRMTKEGKLIDGSGESRLPKVDLVLISHNHRDHVSEATLKRLVKQQPKMIVPKGDEALFLSLGFKDVIGLKWWEQALIQDSESNCLLRLTAVPAKHWSGRGLNDAHCSAFNGYVIHSPNLRGDIYFAGDTALMDDSLSKAIFDNFNILSSIQPGGPDENREDMQSSHQSSADGILMHFKIIAARYAKRSMEEELSWANFYEAIKELKTIYNHTATFKLGNLRLRDTYYSYQRMLAAFQEDEDWRNTHLPAHEQQVYNRIKALAESLIFEENPLTDEQLVSLILTGINMPKIGQRQDLYCSKGLKQIEPFHYRNLITNHRALTEFDALLQTQLMQGKFELKKLILELLDVYQKPWHAFYSRSCTELDSFKRELQTLEQPRELVDCLARREKTLANLNPHGHMQSLIHYAKWLCLITLQNQETSFSFLDDYFRCQVLRKMVDEEINNKALTNQEQNSLRTLADSFAAAPCSQEAYRETYQDWLKTKAQSQQQEVLASANPSSLFKRGSFGSNGLQKIAALLTTNIERPSP